MFKSSHTFTCPDVIYLMNRQKKINRISLLVNLIFLGGLISWGAVEKRLEDKIDRHENTNP